MVMQIPFIVFETFVNWTVWPFDGMQLPRRDCTPVRPPCWVQKNIDTGLPASHWIASTGVSLPHLYCNPHWHSIKIKVTFSLNPPTVPYSRILFQLFRLLRLLQWTAVDCRQWPKQLARYLSAKQCRPFFPISMWLCGSCLRYPMAIPINRRFWSLKVIFHGEIDHSDFPVWLVKFSKLFWTDTTVLDL